MPLPSFFSLSLIVFLLVLLLVLLRVLLLVVMLMILLCSCSFSESCCHYSRYLVSLQLPTLLFLPDANLYLLRFTANIWARKRQIILIEVLRAGTTSVNLTFGGTYRSLKRYQDYLN